MKTERVESTIAEAFSRTAEKYDQFANDHPHLDRVREKVIQHVEEVVPAVSRILELNSGTGTDAVSLVKRGFHVHATDISPGMLARLADKIERFELSQRLTYQSCSFAQLDQVEGGPYDAIFSNLGGLNCIPDLSPVIEQLPLVLRPGGIVTWVLMPPVCLWELALIVTGQFKQALRRLAPRGTIAHLEGLYFPVYYFTPARVKAAFGSQYELMALEGLSVITPTTESKNLYKRWPRLYRTLAWVDDRLSPRWPWHSWGDFYIITFRYHP